MSRKCFSCQQWMRDALNGSLEKSRQIELAKHIEDCPQCRADWEQEQKIVEALHHMPHVVPSGDLQSNVWQQIDAHQKVAMRFPIRTSVFGLGMGLAVAGTIFLVWYMPRQELKTQPIIPAVVVSEAEFPSVVKNETIVSIAASEQVELSHAKGVAAGYPEEHVKKAQPTESLKAEIQSPAKDITIGFQMPTVSRRNSRPKVHEPAKTGNLKIAAHAVPELASEKSSISEVNASQQQIMASPVVGSTRFHIYQNVIHIQKGEQCRFELVLKEPASISLAIYSRAGKKIIMIVQETLSAGTYEWIWNGAMENGQSVASGIYFAVWQMNQKVVEKQKIVVIK